jgi:hypothetical protein
MLEDACKTFFNESIKKIGSQIASYQKSNATSSFASIQHIYSIMDGSTGIYTADSSRIGYIKSLADGQTAHDADQTAPTIAGQTVPYLGQIVPPVVGLTASLTTGQIGCLAGQTGLSIADQIYALEPLPEFCPTTNSTDFNCYLPHVSTISHVIPHTHVIHNDNAVTCIAESSDGSDCANNLCNKTITSIAEPKVGSDCFTNLDNNATINIAEPSDGLDCVTSLNNDGIAKPSDRSDCVASLDNSIVENIAKLNDGSDCITNENELSLSPKTESQIGHVSVENESDNDLRGNDKVEYKQHRIHIQGRICLEPWVPTPLHRISRACFSNF